ncbi:MAG: polynucleotide adenylyltransferase [Proteobacteria bacterium]|nr:polynucleotide adenylyltransferase [Pseudomonadota bacterium]
MIEPRVIEICRAVGAAGGRALIVGGYVRDRLRGEDPKDVDVEVFGLPLAELRRILSRYGRVVEIGRAFGVLRLREIDVDFSLPRRDSKVGAGHRGFDVECDPELSFAEAARRRDLTINSMSLDPLTGEIVDPHAGRDDLERGVLRATDPARFAEDPLRGLRVAQFAARFEMRADAELLRECAALDLGELAAERIYEEFRKLLLKGVRPSLGLELLRETSLLRFFPELERLVGVPQDPQWHPEGDVWVHNQLVVDEAARLRQGRDDEDLGVMFGALCHDFGKPSTTAHSDGRIRSLAHDVEGVAPARAFLERMRAPAALTGRVAAFVRYHLAPALYVKNAAGPKAYRRLARKLAAAGATLEELARVARSDHLGRTTPDALARRFEAGDRFLEIARELTVSREAVPDVVRGRDLIARGIEPGPGFGPILARCREVQDETGWTEPEPILERVFSETDPERPG